MNNYKNSILLIISILFLSLGKTYSQTNRIIDKYTILNTYLEQNGEAYIKIFTSSKDDINQISKTVSVDQVDKNHALAYLNLNQFKEFKEIGFQFELLPKHGELIIPKMFNGSKESYDWNTYPTYESYISIMEGFAIDYPDICQVFSIGITNEGRELMFVKISDNVYDNETEPQFLYTATMHGDETAGYVILLRLIEHLLSQYGNDASATQLVNETEIWINPLANPDGTFHGGNASVFGAIRGNANYIDLNRNYPDPEDGSHPDGNAWQVETLAFMALTEDNNFVLSANIHGGAEVVNYPWDTWSQLAADDDWWQYIAHEYADTAQYFSPSSYFNGFNDGITNGYAWYSIAGGRQDYMNFFHHCREMTLEISDVKLLPESQLDDFWNYNKQSLLNYIKQSQYGVRGLVTDFINETHLYAKVDVLNHDTDESYVFTRVNQGNYHRLLKAGIYDLRFSADGYISQDFQNVQVIDRQPTILNVALSPTCYPLDFDCDCDVDIVDVTMAAYRYGTEIGDANYDPAFDLDSDGDIDIVDITMVTYNYGWNCGKGSSEIINFDNVNNDNAILGLSSINNNYDGTYDIELYIENIEQFGGYELDLGFNPNSLEVLSIEQGDFIGNTDRTIHPLLNVIDNKIGRIYYSVATLGSQIDGVSGKGTLLKIRCKLLNSSKETLDLIKAQLVRIDAKIINYTFKSNEVDLINIGETYIISTYPSPFKNNMSIQYKVGHAGKINFKFYNVYGGLIKTTEDVNMKTGSYTKAFNNLDLSAGVYIVSLELNGMVVNTRRIIVK